PVVFLRARGGWLVHHACVAVLAGGELVSADRLFGLLPGVFIAVLALVAVFVVRYETSNMTAFLNRHGWPVEPSPEHSGGVRCPAVAECRPSSLQRQLHCRNAHNRSTVVTTSACNVPRMTR